MKYIRQLGIILLVSFLGELLHYLLPLPVPASIYGMAILFAGLMTGLIKLDSVRETGKFLIEIMPLMFIPAAVGLLESWPVLKPMCGPIVAITVLSTVTVLLRCDIQRQDSVKFPWKCSQTSIKIPLTLYQTLMRPRKSRRCSLPAIRIFW